MNTAPSPNTAAPPTIWEVDIPSPAVDAALVFRRFGRAADSVFFVDESGVDTSRDVEDSTNPICLRLHS